MTVRTIGTSTSSTRSVASLLRRIRTLPADPAVDDPRKWYRTQKEHWIGWLAQYDGPGAYGRRTDVVRDARYAYNHIVEPAMLLYLAKAAGIDRRRVCAARLAASATSTLMQASAAIRGEIGWDDIERALWPPRPGP